MSTASQQTKPLLELKGLEKRFDLDKGFLETVKLRGGRLTRERRSVHAVNNVSLNVDRGEALCIVGESGCGKSTVARLVAGLLSPTGGEIHYDGDRIDDRIHPAQRRVERRAIGGIHRDTPRIAGGDRTARPRDRFDPRRLRQSRHHPPPDEAVRTQHQYPHHAATRCRSLIPISAARCAASRSASRSANAIAVSVGLAWLDVGKTAAPARCRLPMP